MNWGVARARYRDAVGEALGGGWVPGGGGWAVGSRPVSRVGVTVLMLNGGVPLPAASQHRARELLSQVCLDVSFIFFSIKNQAVSDRRRLAARFLFCFLCWWGFGARSAVALWTVQALLQLTSPDRLMAVVTRNEFADSSVYSSAPALRVYLACTKRW